MAGPRFASALIELESAQVLSMSWGLAKGQLVGFGSHKCYGVVSVLGIPIFRMQRLHRCGPMGNDSHQG